VKSSLIRWFVLTLSVWIADFLLKGIRSDSLAALLVASLVLGVLNTFIKPLLTLLSLPFILVTLGLFFLVINTLLLMLTGLIVPGFHVDGFWWALAGSLIISLTGMFFGVKTRVQPRPPTHRAGPVLPTRPGKNDDIIDI
jgi:putative membrane protein